MSDVWGGGSSGGDYGDMFGDADGGDSADDQAFREIEQLARANIGGERADGVLGGVGYAVAPPRSPSYTRKRTGFSNTGKGRKPGPASLGNGTDPTTDANGAGVGVRIPPAATSRLAEQVERSDGGVLPSGFPRVIGPGPVEVEERLGTRNTANDVFPTGFTHAHIRCAVKDLKFTVSGDLEMRVTIPFEYRMEGTKFADAYGVELELDAKRVEYGND